jgi:hypothetical protein
MLRKCVPLTTDASASPWLFAGAVPSGSRPAVELHRRVKNTRYLPRDSPIAGQQQTVLTGTAWHTRVQPTANATSCERLCGPRGVCVEFLPDAVVPLTRCDCAPYTWGPTCSLPTVPAKRSCVHNDSAPWQCAHPVCRFRAAEINAIQGATRRCYGTPVSRCPRGCLGHGTCVAGRCVCFVGYLGVSCEIVAPADCMRNCSGRGSCSLGFCLCTPPYHGIDCSLAPGLRRRCTARPCIYIYDLPSRMNVLATVIDWYAIGMGLLFDCCSIAARLLCDCCAIGT